LFFLLHFTNRSFDKLDLSLFAFPGFGFFGDSNPATKALDVLDLLSGWHPMIGSAGATAARTFSYPGGLALGCFGFFTHPGF
jgi:hypothetical protein